MATHSPLLFGFATRDITPAPGAPMWGYTNRSGPATGTLDPLFAKAMVFRAQGKTAAVVVLDLGRPPMDSMRADLSKRAAGAGIDHVTFLATHTHHAPIMEDETAPYLDAMGDTIGEALEAAVHTLRPVTVWEGAADIDIGHNRRLVADGQCRMLWRNAERRPTSPVDREAVLLQFRDGTSGDALCTLVHFACHPVIMGPSNLQYSADWPGAMCRVVESATGAPCVFVQGGCGDINPYLDKTPLDEGGVESMEATGLSAGSAVVAGLDTLTPLPGGSCEVAWTERPVTIGTRWDFKDAGQRALFSAFYGEIFEKCYVETAEGDLTITVDLVMLNRTIAFVAVPGEVFVRDQLALKESGPLRHTLLCGYGNGYYAYFPPIRDAMAGGYGGTVGSLAGWGAAERIMLEAQLGLVTLLGEVDRPATAADFAIIDAE